MFNMLVWTGHLSGLDSCNVYNYLSYTGQRMDRAIFLGAFQSLVTHVMYWLWSSSATKHPWDLCYDIEHDDWRHILRVVHCLFHQRHTDHGLSWSQLQGKGGTCLFSYSLTKCADPFSGSVGLICVRHFHSMSPLRRPCRFIRPYEFITDTPTAAICRGSPVYVSWQIETESSQAFSGLCMHCVPMTDTRLLVWESKM